MADCEITRGTKANGTTTKTTTCNDANEGTRRKTESLRTNIVLPVEFNRSRMRSDDRKRTDLEDFRRADLQKAVAATEMLCTIKMVFSEIHFGHGFALTFK